MEPHYGRERSYEALHHPTATTSAAHRNNNNNNNNTPTPVHAPRLPLNDSPPVPSGRLSGQRHHYSDLSEEEIYSGRRRGGSHHHLDRPPNRREHRSYNMLPSTQIAPHLNGGPALYVHGRPTVIGDVVERCFPSGNGLLFRIHEQSKMRWSFYNDTTTFMMYVYYSLGADSKVRPGERATMTRNPQNQRIEGELWVSPGATETLLTGEVVGYKFWYSAIPRRTEEERAMEQKGAVLRQQPEQQYHPPPPAPPAQAATRQHQHQPQPQPHTSPPLPPPQRQTQPQPSTSSSQPLQPQQLRQISSPSYSEPLTPSPPHPQIQPLDLQPLQKRRNVREGIQQPMEQEAKEHGAKRLQILPDSHPKPRLNPTPDRGF